MVEQTWLRVEVKNKHVEATDIVCLELADPDGRSLPPFSAGAHIDVKTPTGLVRQYSLCNDPSERHRYVIAVLREPRSRGGSVAMHETVRQGDRLAIRSPRNHFGLVPGVKRSLLLAGGIGITPILSMAHQLALSGGDFEMHYAARSTDRMAFLGRIRRSSFMAKVRLHVDNGEPTQRLDLVAVLGGPDVGKHLYVCGPKGFMDAVVTTARSLGWPAANVHFEHFNAAPKGDAGAAFDVVLRKSCKVIRIPDGVTVLEALRASGIDVPVSCEQGVCGTCVTRVLDGVPDHRDVFLTDDERARNDQFMPCCSRAHTSELVLDL